jgi:hypothetical protein
VVWVRRIGNHNLDMRVLWDVLQATTSLREILRHAEYLSRANALARPEMGLSEHVKYSDENPVIELDRHIGPAVQPVEARTAIGSAHRDVHRIGRIVPLIQRTVWVRQTRLRIAAARAIESTAAVLVRTPRRGIGWIPPVEAAQIIS